jgi:hypothetical protein
MRDIGLHPPLRVAGPAPVDATGPAGTFNACDRIEAKDRGFAVGNPLYLDRVPHVEGVFAGAAFRSMRLQSSQRISPSSATGYSARSRAFTRCQRLRHQVSVLLWGACSVQLISPVTGDVKGTGGFAAAAPFVFESPEPASIGGLHRVGASRQRGR